MREAASRAGVAAEDLGFVCASACGSRTFDAFEARAIGEFLGPASADVPVTAPKGATGDLSASGVIRSVIAISALERGFVPGTARFEEPEAGLPIQVVREPLAAPRSSRALVVGSGPGGCHAALVLSGA
jgi:3-oxoacyl-[acyl-carrier-protein] synthase II